MEKRYFLMFIVLTLVGLVTAYTMSSFIITVNVAEPLEIEYVIVESDNVTDCQTPGLPYSPVADFSMPDIYPGESRAICLEINNSASIELPFELTSEVTTNNNLNDCEYALGSPGITGDVTAKSVSIHGTVITVPTDAVATNDCELTLSVDRG